MTIPSDECLLEIDRLCYAYPGGGPVLNAVSLTVSVGEVLGVVGPNGAGKSTLLMHLNGLLPERGYRGDRANNSPAVRVRGLPMRPESLAEIRRMVGLLFQDPDDQLFCPTVRDDVAFGPLNMGLSQSDVEQRVAETLRAVGLETFGPRSPRQLSLGEQKRVCLAGVLACRPELLLLDEPSSNLDPRARRRVLSILKLLPATQIIATHDLDLVLELCDRIVVLDEGRLRAEGPPADILSDEALMQRHGLEVPWALRPDHARPHASL